MTDITDTPEIKHIPGFESPEDILLLPHDMLELFEKFSQWQEAMPESTVVVSRLVSTPLVTERAGRPNIEIISHPMVWLGERQRMRLLDDNGEPETQDHMMLRVALELLTSNVYTPNVGWVDCLSLMGLDKYRDRERIQAWIDGGEDPMLDTFSLDTVLTDEDEPEWSFDAATEEIDALLDISYGYMARSAANTARSVLEAPERPGPDDEGESWTLTERSQTCAFVAQVAFMLLGGTNGPLSDYSERIMLDDDPTNPSSFAWEFVRECESLATRHEETENKLLEGFTPVDVESLEKDADEFAAETDAEESEASREDEQTAQIESRGATAVE